MGRTLLKCFIELLNPLNTRAELVGLSGPVMEKNVIKPGEAKDHATSAVLAVRNREVQQLK